MTDAELTEIRESYTLAMSATGTISSSTIEEVNATVADAIDNNMQPMSATQAIDFLRDNCKATTEAKMHSLTGATYIQVLVPIESITG